MNAELKARIYLDFVKKIKAVEENKEMRAALIDDYLENGHSAQEIIKELLDALNKNKG